MASPRAQRSAAQPSVRTVGELLAELDNGLLRVEPDRTGAPEWPEHRKRLLLDSVLRGWPIGPIYVLVDNKRTRTVVDGGQRLATLRQFVSGDLDVDGRMTPHEEMLQEIDGKTYGDLPTGLRAAIDDYPLVLIEFHGPSSTELRPALVRLNGTDKVATSNQIPGTGAFAEQVRRLVVHAADWGLTRDRVGFSNAGLAYEDAISRVILAIEHDDPGAAGKSTETKRRIKDAHETSADIFEQVSWSLRTLVSLPAVDGPAVRFGKATLTSWLLLLTRAQRQFGPGVEHYIDYLMEWFEPQRRRLAAGLDLDVKAPLRGRLANLPASELLAVFNERAAVEALAGESFAVRDAILWLFLVAIGGAPKEDLPPVPQVISLYDQLTTRDIDGALAKLVQAGEWGRWT